MASPPGKRRKAPLPNQIKMHKHISKVRRKAPLPSPIKMHKHISKAPQCSVTKTHNDAQAYLQNVSKAQRKAPLPKPINMHRLRSRAQHSKMYRLISRTRVRVCGCVCVFCFWNTQRFTHTNSVLTPLASSSPSFGSGLSSPANGSGAGRSKRRRSRIS